MHHPIGHCYIWAYWCRDTHGVTTFMGGTQLGGYVPGILYPVTGAVDIFHIHTHVLGLYKDIPFPLEYCSWDLPLLARDIHTQQGSMGGSGTRLPIYCQYTLEVQWRTIPPDQTSWPHQCQWPFLLHLQTLVHLLPLKAAGLLVHPQIHHHCRWFVPLLLNATDH